MESSLVNMIRAILLHVIRSGWHIAYGVTDPAAKPEPERSSFIFKRVMWSVEKEKNNKTPISGISKLTPPINLAILRWWTRVWRAMMSKSRRHGVGGFRTIIIVSFISLATRTTSHHWFCKLKISATLIMLIIMLMIAMAIPFIVIWMKWFIFSIARTLLEHNADLSYSNSAGKDR